jgi:DNA replication protein DnaC
LESFDNIELDEAEKEEALRLGREKKHYRIEREKYNQKISMQPEYLRFAAEQLFDKLKQALTIDSENEIIVKRLCAYFANDPRFETTDLKLHKGIIMFGGVGVGKTTLLSTFRQNQAFSFRIISCREIESAFAEQGDSIVQHYSVNYPVATNSNPFGHQEIGYCFDDLGTEASISKYYGKAKNVMAEILLNRYDNRLDYRATHITTNLSVNEIEAIYGTRVIDRIRESFNMIAFTPDAKSRR